MGGAAVSLQSTEINWATGCLTTGRAVDLTSHVELDTL